VAQPCLQPQQPPSSPPGRFRIKKLGRLFDLQVDNGAAALAQLQECEADRFQMILMDCNMPVMDGWTATREIRMLEQRRRLTTMHPRIPIVGLSASSVVSGKQQCLAAGMDDYLTKPVMAKDQIVNIAKWNCTLQQLTVGAGSGNCVKQCVTLRPEFRLKPQQR
jgi:CheY-like chemotaxis protein